MASSLRVSMFSFRTLRTLTTPALTLDLLSWIDVRSRSYEETIEAWKTSCPRLSVWDDAVIDGLVQIDRSQHGATVVLTALGRTALANR